VTGRCVFCLNSPANSGEHLFDDWVTDVVRAVFPDIRFTITDYDRSTSNGPPPRSLRTYPKRRVDRTSPVVCKDCNNGWMNDVTNASATELKQMIISDLRQPRRIEATGLRALVDLVFLKAVVHDMSNLAEWPRTAFFDGSARQRFRSSRRRSSLLDKMSTESH
jgi:hypothetical protein